MTSPFRLSFIVDAWSGLNADTRLSRSCAIPVHDLVERLIAAEGFDAAWRPANRVRPRRGRRHLDDFLDCGLGARRPPLAG